MLNDSVHEWKVDESKFKDIFMKISTSISADERLKDANLILNEKSPALKLVRDLYEKEKDSASGGLNLDNCMKNIRRLRVHLLRPTRRRTLRSPLPRTTEKVKIYSR